MSENHTENIQKIKIGSKFKGMNVLEKPNVQGYWWWLPLCNIEDFATGTHPSENLWCIRYLTPDCDMKGIFIGPLDYPKI